MQRIVAPKTEYLREPIGLGEALPRLSWKMDDARRGARQTAFQVVAASRPELLAAAPDLWDTGRVVGGDGTGIPWGGAALTSRRRVFWRVRVWDAGNHLSDWSETASFEMGLLETGDWKARWIGRKADWSERSCPFLRRVFRLDKPVLRARAHVTARGVFELHLNGSRVGKDFFAPGWTDYGRRLQVSTYDVTSLLREGENVLGSVLGDGWYAGRIRGLGRRFWYGRRLSLLVQLEVEHPDGSRTVVAGDRKWKSAAGPIHEADFYDGETYDARREMPGWSESGFDDSEWKPVVFFGAPTALLVSSPCPPIRRQEELPAKSLSEPLPGVHVFDLGQNMTGFARVALRQRRGLRIVVRFAEMLQADGTLYTANLRTAKCTDTYICRGGGEECFEPHFTFHGFRYVELSGLAGKPRLDDIVGVVLHADMSETGRFSCSDERLNRLHRNIVWSQKGNFLGIPTDCPQRDERLGWTGDAQIFARTACCNFDVATFFAKWCVDLDDAQRADGAFTNTAPDVYDGAGGEAGYGDAGVIVPWTIHLCYGDTRILERHYAAMARWIGWREANSPGLICPHAFWGDWLAIDETPRDLIATAYFVRSADLMAKTAAVLGRKADRLRYSRLGARIRKAFNRAFVMPGGTLACASQTACLLALGFDLLPPVKRQPVLERLVTDIAGRGFHLSTGFIGTPLLAPVLARFGRVDVALRLLTQTTCPSWLYPLLQGATTTWERWNSFTHEHGFGDAGMNSFNHYAYGAIGEWLYAGVAGIDLDPEEPGYRHVLFRPCPGEGIAWAEGRILSRFGWNSCAWRVEDGRLRVEVVVPPNAHGTVFLPGRNPKAVRSGTHRFDVRMPVRPVEVRGDYRIQT